MIIAFPGPISKDGLALDAPTLVGNSSNLPDLRAILRSKTGRDVHLLNDMSAAAWHVSKTTAVARFLVVTVSSGIGSKIFDREHPRRVLDDVAYAGEIGHVVVDTSAAAPLSDCGGRGHLGAIASGRGFTREARRRAHADPAAFLASLCVTQFGATADDLSNKPHLVPAILAGDAWATNVLDDCVGPLASIIATVVLAAGIQRVVIIGGFAQSVQDAYMLALRRHLARLADYSELQPVTAGLVVAPPPTEEVCLLGAAVFAEEQLGC